MERKPLNGQIRFCTKNEEAVQILNFHISFGFFFWCRDRGWICSLSWPRTHSVAQDGLKRTWISLFRPFQVFGGYRRNQLSSAVICVWWEKSILSRSILVDEGMGVDDGTSSGIIHTYIYMPGLGCNWKENHYFNLFLRMAKWHNTVKELYLFLILKYFSYSVFWLYSFSSPNSSPVPNP